MQVSRWVSDGVGRRRQLLAVALGVVLLPALTAVLTASREQLSLADDLLLYLLAVLGITVVGGLWPAVAASIAAGLCLNWYLTPPVHTWTIESAQNIVALLLFVAAAVTVSGVVHLAARQSAASRRSAAEAQELVALAQTVLTGSDDPQDVLDHLERSRGVCAELQEQVDGRWIVVTASGRPVAAGAPTIEIRPGLRLRYDEQGSVSRRLLDGYAAQAAATLDRSRLRTQVAQAEALAEGDRMRTALLAAVSHDLRTPLAAVKAGVSSLRQTDVQWSPADLADLTLTIEEGADRLDEIIENLLDMSRVQTGTVQPLLRPTAVDEVLPPALTGLDRDRLHADVSDDLPFVLADPGLLERVLANLVANALRFSPEDRPVTVHARTDGGDLLIDIVDHGPGVPENLRTEMFAPFQQLGDRKQNRGGVGLGLAVARGFTEAMHGDVTATTTPGGGLTMTVRLPVAVPGPAVPGPTARTTGAPTTDASTTDAPRP